jgi:hypothetical protein
MRLISITYGYFCGHQISVGREVVTVLVRTHAESHISKYWGAFQEEGGANYSCLLEDGLLCIVLLRHIRTSMDKKSRGQGCSACMSLALSLVVRPTFVRLTFSASKPIQTSSYTRGLWTNSWLYCANCHIFQRLIPREYRLARRICSHLREPGMDGS